MKVKGYKIDETLQRRAVAIAAQGLLFARTGGAFAGTLADVHAALRARALWNGELFPRTAMELGQVLVKMRGDLDLHGFRIEGGDARARDHWRLSRA